MREPLAWYVGQSSAGVGAGVDAVVADEVDGAGPVGLEDGGCDEPPQAATAMARTAAATTHGPADFQALDSSLPRIASIAHNHDCPVTTANDKPLLLIDVDGVISLFGFDPEHPPAGKFQLVDGIAHLLSATAGDHLRALADEFELAWCTGWEEKANEYLPLALEISGPLPCLLFGSAVPTPEAHWKLATVDEFAGPSRPLAWIDDAHDESCVSWAQQRPGPTLLVSTEPATGMSAEHVEMLLEWARAASLSPRS